jgi:chromosome segregation ATPase
LDAFKRSEYQLHADHRKVHRNVETLDRQIRVLKQQRDSMASKNLDLENKVIGLRQKLVDTTNDAEATHTKAAAIQQQAVLEQETVVALDALLTRMKQELDAVVDERNHFREMAHKAYVAFVHEQDELDAEQVTADTLRQAHRDMSKMTNKVPSGSRYLHL